MKPAHFLYLALAMWSAAATAGLGDTPITVKKLDQSAHPWHRIQDFHKPNVHRVSLPYFDEQQGIHWVEEPVAQTGACDGSLFPEAGKWSPLCQRTTLLLTPRVDKCKCTGNLSTGTARAGTARTGILLMGIDSQLQERWRRKLYSPLEREAPHLVGSNAQGMVFSDMEVWSPVTGETIRPKDPAGSVSFYSTCYLPERNAYLQFDAEVTPLRSKGGLYLYHPHTGSRELVLAVDRSLMGYYKIEDMVALPGERWILLGERFTTRGPGNVRFQLFDLESERVVFSEKFAKGHYVADARVTPGDDGNVAFSFLDETAGEYTLVHYRIQGLK
jgi:hypothetical protein